MKNENFIHQMLKIAYCSFEENVYNKKCEVQGCSSNVDGMGGTMNRRSKLMRDIVMLSQLGVSLVTPPLVLTWLCYWLSEKFQIGAWLIVLGLIFGLLVSISTAFSFYKKMTHSAQQKDEPPSSFNSHE